MSLNSAKQGFFGWHKDEKRQQNNHVPWTATFYLYCCCSSLERCLVCSFRSIAIVNGSDVMNLSTHPIKSHNTHVLTRVFKLGGSFLPGSMVGVPRG